MKEKEYNICVDGQNLHRGLEQFNWKVDFKKFRIFLRDKYQVEEAYYYVDGQNLHRGLTMWIKNSIYRKTKSYKKIDGKMKLEIERIKEKIKVR